VLFDASFSGDASSVSFILQFGFARKLLDEGGHLTNKTFYTPDFPHLVHGSSQ